MKKLLIVVLAIAIALVLSSSLVFSAPANGRPSGTKGGKDVISIVFLDYASGYVSPIGGGTDSNPTYKTRVDAKWATLSIPWEFYSTGAPISALTEIQSAFVEWDSWTSEILFNYAGLASSVGPVVDDHNTVGFVPLDGQDGIIAGTWVLFDMKEKLIVEFDMVLDIADFGPYNIQNVATHEIGHTLFLDDLKMPFTSQLTMYAYITSEAEDYKSTLGDGDILGLWHLYGE